MNQNWKGRLACGGVGAGAVEMCVEERNRGPADRQEKEADEMHMNILKKKNRDLESPRSTKLQEDWSRPLTKND